MTDVAWDTAGNTFISDGYINSRVAKVDKDGEWLKSWGERGTRARPVPHAPLHRGRRAGQRLRRRSRQPAHPGVRRRRQISAPVHDQRARAARRQARDRQYARRSGNRCGHVRARLALGDLHLAAARSGPLSLRRLSRPHLQADASRARCSACSGRSGKQLKQFGWIHEMACPTRERALRRRTPELARAEAPARLTVDFQRRSVIRLLARL